MATTKKSAKKTVKKAPVKPTSKTKVRCSVAPTMQSFKRFSPDEPFFTFRVSQQTIYWAFLGIAVLALGLWVITINDKVQYIYDQVDEANSALNQTLIKKK
ncbi:MAG: hypothetical protein WAQ25_01590 [Candidatus Saccharimonas sp.]